MRLLVRYLPPFRRWHLRLAERLEGDGHVVRFETSDARLVGRLQLALERRLYGVVPDADARAPPPAPLDMPCDAILDLAGPAPSTAVPALAFDVEGRAGEPNLFTAARRGEAPLIRVQGLANGDRRLLAVGRPAVEDPWVASRALESLLPRLVTLLVQAVGALAGGTPALPVEAEHGAAHPPSALRFLFGGFGAKALARFGRARGRPEHWRIGVRRAGGGPAAMLPENPGRFRADPFLFAEAGHLWLFAEDYPYASGKGIITCQGIAPLASVAAREPASDDLASPPRVVLEEPFHLSYPLVLRHGGEIYMLPEAAASGYLTLYRARDFPWRWEPAARLLAGRYADATPVRHDGRWWLFATACNEGSSWDQLHLFHAPDLLGPWAPHGGNPVLIDAAAARPAGDMWREGGALLRPVQDCRRGYGGGVLVYRVDLLDTTEFRQTLVRRVPLPPGQAARGLHTINRAAGWEAFDVKVPHPRR